MKKVLTFSLIVLLASSGLVGCKSGTSCFTRTGSRVPIIGSSSSDYTDVAYGSNGARVINANPTNEVMMMNAASAYSQCVPCAPAQCAPCAPAQASCNPCDPCSTARSGVSASGYPTSAASYSGIWANTISVLWITFKGRFSRGVWGRTRLLKTIHGI